MATKRLFYVCLLLCLLLFAAQTVKGAATGDRKKREFAVKLNASFEEQIGGELSAEMEGNIWRNEAGTARLDGSATYSQHIDNADSLGNAKVTASVQFRYD